MSRFKRNRTSKFDTDAAALHAQARYTELESLSRDAIARDPANADAWFWLGLALADLDRGTEAVEALLKARSLNPALGGASMNAAQILLGQERFEEAEALLEPLLREHPDAHYAIPMRVRALVGLRRMTECVQAADDAMRVEPEEDDREGWSNALNGMGIGLAQCGLNDAAEAALLRSSDLEPNAPAYDNLGIVYTHAERPLDALFAFLRAAELEPNRPRIYYNLARALTTLDPGIAACQKVITLDPDYPDVRINLGRLLDQRGRSDEAEEQFREAVSRYKSAEARSALADFLYGEDRHDEAETEALAALDMDASEVLALRVVGDCHAVRGDYARARSCYEDAIRKAPAWWLPRWYVARVDALQRDKAALLDSLESALEVDRSETIQAFQHDEVMEPFRADISIRALLHTAGLVGGDPEDGD